MQYSLSANLHRRHLNAGQRAVVALKVRELLQPAARERQREAAAEAATVRPRDEAGRLQVTTDLRSPIQKEEAAAEQRRQDRNVAAQAAKAVGASPRTVEQAAWVAKAAPDLLPQVQAGTLALDRARAVG